jgi:hypothetical protein
VPAADLQGRRVHDRHAVASRGRLPDQREHGLAGRSHGEHGRSRAG